MRITISTKKRRAISLAILSLLIAFSTVKLHGVLISQNAQAETIPEKCKYSDYEVLVKYVSYDKDPEGVQPPALDEPIYSEAVGDFIHEDFYEDMEGRSEKSVKFTGTGDIEKDFEKVKKDADDGAWDYDRDEGYDNYIKRYSGYTRIVRPKPEDKKQIYTIYIYTIGSRGYPE